MSFDQVIPLKETLSTFNRNYRHNLMSVKRQKHAFKMFIVKAACVYVCAMSVCAHVCECKALEH